MKYKIIMLTIIYASKLLLSYFIFVMLQSQKANLDLGDDGDEGDEDESEDDDYVGGDNE